MINHFVNDGIEYEEDLIIKIVNQIFTDYRINLIELNIIQLKDDELLEVNIEHLGHDYYTDIITFNYGSDKTVQGELYISYDRVEQNEIENGIRNEIYRYIIHGCLHLCGVDDNTKELKKQIHNLEDKYLKMFHVEQ